MRKACEHENTGRLALENNGFTKELPKLNSAVFEEDSVFEETEFTANITIEQKQ